MLKTFVFVVLQQKKRWGYETRVVSRNHVHEDCIGYIKKDFICFACEAKKNYKHFLP